MRNSIYNCNLWEVNKVLNELNLPEDTPDECFVWWFIINFLPSDATIQGIKHSISMNSDPINPEKWNLEFKAPNPTATNVPKFRKVRHGVILYFDSDVVSQTLKNMTLSKLSELVELQTFELSDTNFKNLDYKIAKGYNGDNCYFKDVLQVKMHEKYTNCLTLDLDVLLTMPLFDFIIAQSKYYLKFKPMYIEKIKCNTWWSLEKRNHKITNLHLPPIFLHMNPKWCILNSDRAIDSTCCSIDACLTLCDTEKMKYRGMVRMYSIEQFKHLKLDYYISKELPNFLNPLIIRSNQCLDKHDNEMVSLNWVGMFENETRPYFEIATRFKHVQPYIERCELFIKSLKDKYLKHTKLKFKNDNVEAIKLISDTIDYDPIHIL
ncbi:hypothetical protein MrNuV_ORF055 [Macrobrachium rosenbergii nudivirus]|nr:hypothetical protein MrNuV_ORF055 [Macrobrachium rosenbergii nudivirus]